MEENVDSIKESIRNEDDPLKNDIIAVSYTHLTLPTKRIV